MKTFSVWRRFELAAVALVVALFSSCGLFSSKDSSQDAASVYVAFDKITLDTIVPLLETSEFPSLSIKVDVECPVRAGSDDQLQSVGYLVSSLVDEGSNLGAVGPNVREMIDLCVSNHVSEYKAEGLEDLENYRDDPEGAATWLNYEYSLTGECVYNRDSILSYRVTIFSYNGGAHGLYGSTYGVVNLIACSPIHLADFVTEESEPELTKLLKASVAREFKCPNFEALKSMDILFKADALALTENFYVDSLGVTWHFDPYEIAPFSVGSIEACIPWDQLHPLLPEGCDLLRLSSKYTTPVSDPNPDNQ